jgi:DNA-binding transcriptional regulator YdaS (Cro superfamily)
MRNEALKEAIGVAGGQLALADKIGVGQSLVSYWLKKSKKGVAAGFVLAIEAATGTPRERLRPDLYPPTPSHGGGPPYISDPSGPRVHRLQKKGAFSLKAVRDARMAPNRIRQ